MPDGQRKEKRPYMRKARKLSEDLEIRTEYTRANFSKLTRGKFHQQVVASSNVVILDSTVAKEFPNSIAVNKALKTLISKRKTAIAPKRTVARAKKSTRLHQAAKRR